MQAMSDELVASKCPGEVFAVKCDLGKEEEILEMFEQIKTRYKRLDICINSAGVCHADGLLAGKTEHWRSMFEVGPCCTLHRFLV
jgi:NAD(P)-dependent dehydrogenase (short-subunit alcohol dehydrogenase family)